MDLLPELPDRRTVQMKRGDLVYEAGAVPHGFYLVESGLIKLIYPATEEISLMSLAFPGSSLGLHYLIRKEQYGSSAVAMSDAELIYIPGKTLLQKVKTHPQLSLIVMQLMGRETEEIEERLASLARRTTSERLAEVLMLLRHHYGLSPNHELNLQPGLADLAGLVGTSPGNIYKTFSQFSRKGWADYHQNRVRIMQPAALELMA